jgi:hypothetical protein
MCRQPLMLTPRLLLGVLADLAANDRAPVLRGERWRFVLKARRAPTLTTAAANRCGACSDIDEANDSPRE